MCIDISAGKSCLSVCDRFFDGFVFVVVVVGIATSSSILSSFAVAEFNNLMLFSVYRPYRMCERHTNSSVFNVFFPFARVFVGCFGFYFDFWTFLPNCCSYFRGESLFFCISYD